MTLSGTESNTTDDRVEPRYIDVVALATQAPSVDDIDYDSLSTAIDISSKRIGIKTLVDSPQTLATWARAKYRLGHYHEGLSLSKNAELLFQQTGNAHQIYSERLFQVKLFLALSDTEAAEERLACARAGGPQDRTFQKDLLFCEYRIAYSKGELVRARKVLCDIEGAQDSVAETLAIRVLTSVIDMHEKSFSTCASESFFDVESNNPFELPLPPALHKAMVYARLRVAQMLASEGHVLRARHLLIDPTLLSPDLRPHGALASALVLTGEKRFDSAYDRLSSGWQAAAHGLSMGETALLSWYQALISLVAQNQAEAFAHAEKVLVLVKSSHRGGLLGRSLLLSAFLRCLRDDRAEAEELLKQAAEADDSTCSICVGMRVVIEEMLNSAAKVSEPQAESDADMASGNVLETKTFIPRSSFLTVAVLCNCYPAALAALVNRFSMKHIPSEFFDLIDTDMQFEDEHALAIISRADERQMLKIRLAANTPKTDTIAPARGTPYYIRLLGNLGIEHNGHEIDISTWRKSKSRELFLSVLLQAGSDISREQIIETLWPDMSPEKARNNYYVTWSNLKRILQGGDQTKGKSLPIASSGSRCYVSRAQCGVDIIDLVDSIHEGHRAATAGNLIGAIEHYQMAAKLYTGDLLPGDMYNEWVTPHREYYHTMFIEAMVSATTISLELNDPSGAIYFIEHALRFERSREVLYEWAMRTYLHADRREDAIEMFHLCRKHLSEELGLDPSASLRTLYSEAISA